MKRLKLLSLLTVPAIALPITFSVTSCGAYSALSTGYRIVDANSQGKHFYSLNKPNASINSLLWGGKGFNNGNYVLFLTHSMIDKGVSFLLNSHTFVKGDNPQIDTNYAKFDSLSTTINGNYAENLPTTSYQYVVLVEEDTMESYCGSASQQQEVSQPCSPFEKYTAQDEKINSDHKKDTYIRNDGAAKAYRDLTDTISKLFSGVDGTSAGNFLALQWVKGYPAISTAKTGAPWADNLEFAKWLLDNDKNGASWKK